MQGWDGNCSTDAGNCFADRISGSIVFLGETERKTESGVRRYLQLTPMHSYTA